jgi:hypothetical protein
MTWVLIVILNWPSIAMERFPNKASCERAANWIVGHAYTAQAICFEDLKEEPKR